jgi:hypothetical protein
MFGAQVLGLLRHRLGSGSIDSSLNLLDEWPLREQVVQHDVPFQRSR